MFSLAFKPNSKLEKGIYQNLKTKVSDASPTRVSISE